MNATFPRVHVVISILLLFLSPVVAELPRVYEAGERPNDVRLQPLKHLNGYFPFHVPESKSAWEARAAALKDRILVATGLFPMPPRTPLNPVIHGKVEREGFTVEKVYFESMPDHFVTGLLFRPDDGKQEKRPAVLCPHGHGGRLQDYGENQIKQLIADGAERFEESGRFPKLARCAHLARMGCVTFIFDMLGYADSQQIPGSIAHGFRKRRPAMEGRDSWGLFSTQAELRLQSVMGIQTWNSVRCLDFLEQLPDVDGRRIAVTGGSGGGTQTILLCAIDDRPVAAFPNGMVSTAMQGGCTCENCTLLRVDAGNVELAALFAPKPQAMTAANDWTKEMLSKGFPELRRLYGMLGAETNVACRDLTHFPHNYNYVSRATMYRWFNEHLQLGYERPPLEEDYQLLSAEEMRVWDDDHPQPAGGEDYERTLTHYLAAMSDQQMDAISPVQVGDMDAFRKVVGRAVRVLIGRNVPDSTHVERTKLAESEHESYLLFKDVVRHAPAGEELPVITLWPRKVAFNGDVVLWVDGRGKNGIFNEQGDPTPTVHQILDSGAAVVAADLFQQGEFLGDRRSVADQRIVDNGREAAAYTFCYNHALFARRVHDVLTLIAYIRGYDEEDAPERVHLIGTHDAGAVAAAARAIVGEQVDRCVVDTGGFRFESIDTYRDPRFLPGIVKYGDLPALLALSAPHELALLGESTVPPLTEAAYQTADQATPLLHTEDIKAAIRWALRR